MSKQFTEEELKIMYPGRECGGLLSVDERNSLAKHFEKVFEHVEEVQKLHHERVIRDIPIREQYEKEKR